MKKYWQWSFLIIIFIIIVSGCIGDFDINNLFQKTKNQSVFLGGDKGISISLISGSPPSETYQGTNFAIAAQISNHGEADIPTSDLWIKLDNAKIIGLENEDINNDGVWNRLLPQYSDGKIISYLDESTFDKATGTVKESDIPIECDETRCEDINQDGVFYGRVIDLIENPELDKVANYISVYGRYAAEADINENGEFDSIVKRNTEPLLKAHKSEGVLVPVGIYSFSWPDLKYSGEKLTTDLPISFTLKACYPYETRAVSTICITKDGTKSNICNPTGSRDIESSGAPVKVTGFKQTINGIGKDGKAQVGFEIEIEKAGEGEVYDISASCENDVLPYELKDRVSIESITISDYILTLNNANPKYSLIQACGNNYITFNSKGKGKIVCIINYPIINDFSDQFKIILAYKHQINKNFQITFKPFQE